MLIIDLYRLDYTEKEVPQHVLFQISKIKHTALNAGTADNVKIAEWLLDLIEYRSKGLLKTELANGSINVDTARMVGNYLKHIHANCKEEIQSRFVSNPPIDDETVGQIFFENMMKDYFDSIADGSEYDTTKGMNKANSALRIEIAGKAIKGNSDIVSSAGVDAHNALIGLITSKW